MLRVCWFTCLLHLFPLLLLAHEPLFVARKTFSSNFQHPVLQTSPRIVWSTAFEAGNQCRACTCLSPHAHVPAVFGPPAHQPYQRNGCHWTFEAFVLCGTCKAALSSFWCLLWTLHEHPSSSKCCFLPRCTAASPRAASPAPKS
jgi:hypothetical protein